MSGTVKITIYRWEGALGPFRITSECAECDFTVAQVQCLLSSHPDWPIRIEVKPWLGHCWEALQSGGWHAPIVLVNRKLVSQGRVPSPDALERAVQRALNPTTTQEAGFWRRWIKSVPPAPS